jgi:hypothetical protein
MIGPIAPCGTDFIRAVGDQTAGTSQAASAELVPSLRGGGAAGCLEGWNSNKALTLKKVFAFQSFNVANVALLQSFGNPFNPTSQRQFPGKCQCF